MEGDTNRLIRDVIMWLGNNKVLVNGVLLYVQRCQHTSKLRC